MPYQLHWQSPTNQGHSKDLDSYDQSIADKANRKAKKTGRKIWWWFVGVEESRPEAAMIIDLRVLFGDKEAAQQSLQATAFGLDNSVELNDKSEWDSNVPSHETGGA